jgi:hypothetical protein
MTGIATIAYTRNAALANQLLARMTGWLVQAAFRTEQRLRRTTATWTLDTPDLGPQQAVKCGERKAQATTAARAWGSVVLQVDVSCSK